MIDTDSSGPSLIKAAQLQNSLAVARAMAGNKAACLEAALPADLIAAVQGAHRTAWLPVEQDIALATAVEEVLGAGKDEVRARRATRAAMDSSMLKPIVDGARRLFGLSPHKVFRVAVTGWRNVYRHTGQPRFVGVDDRQVQLVFDDMPASVLGHPIYVTAIGAGLSAIFDLCEVVGSFDVAPEPAERRVTYTFRWH